MKLDKKQKIIAVILASIVVITGIFLLVSRNSNTQTKKQAIQPTDAIIPTVDSSVLVSLTPLNGGKQVELAVREVPRGTQSMEYEISYKAKNREAPGIYSVLTLEPGQNNWEKTFDVGTCSSGKCIYDQVEGNMKVRLKFSGDYGDRLFEKDFSFQ